MSLPAAIRIAALKHGQAVDKGGQPFIGHPLRAMASLAAKFHDAPEYALEAAVCHDVLEDTGTDPQELAAEGVTGEALCLVRILTRDEEHEGYFEYIARVKAGIRGGLMVCPFGTHAPDHIMWAIRIKECDLADNLNPQRRVPGMKLPERYERALAMLRG